MSTREVGGCYLCAFEPGPLLLAEASQDGQVDALEYLRPIPLTYHGPNLHCKGHEHRHNTPMDLTGTDCPCLGGL